MLSSATELDLTSTVVKATNLQLQSNLDADGNALTNVGSVESAGTLTLSGASGVTLAGGPTTVTGLTLADDADLAGFTLTNANSVVGQTTLSLASTNGDVDVVAASGKLILSSDSSAPAAVTVDAGAGGVTVTSLHDVTVTPGATYAAIVTNLQLVGAADVNAVTLSNVAGIDGAPQLLTGLDVNGQDLNNVGVINGAPELGANLDAGGFQITNVDSLTTQSLTVVADVTFNNLIEAADIATGGVTTTEILDGTVTSTDVQDGSLTGTDISDGSVDTVDLAHEAVTADKIADDTITHNQIAANAITQSELDANAVTTGHIVDGTITGADVSSTATLSVAVVQASDRLRTGVSSAASAPSCVRGDIIFDGEDNLCFCKVDGTFACIANSGSHIVAWDTP